MNTSMVQTGNGGSPLLLVPQSLEQLERIAKLIANSDLAPKDYRNKPENVAVAVAMGLELGVSPMQAIQGIAVINGRPCVWGDLMLALVRSHPACEWIEERLDYAQDGSVSAAICKAKRRGHEPQERRFSVEDARAAGLLNKDGPWKAYRARMLAMRARAFCLRDLFADALRGLASAEEQADVIDVQAVEVRQAPTHAAPAISHERQPYSAEDFAANLPKWRTAIESGRKTADEVIAMVQTKGALTDEQRATIRGNTQQPAAGLEDAA